MRSTNVHCHKSTKKARHRHIDRKTRTFPLALAVIRKPTRAGKSARCTEVRKGGVRLNRKGKGTMR